MEQYKLMLSSFAIVSASPNEFEWFFSGVENYTKASKSLMGMVVGNQDGRNANETYLKLVENMCMAIVILVVGILLTCFITACQLKRRWKYTKCVL